MNYGYVVIFFFVDFDSGVAVEKILDPCLLMFVLIPREVSTIGPEGKSVASLKPFVAALWGLGGWIFDHLRGVIISSVFLVCVDHHLLQKNVLDGYLLHFNNEIIVEYG